MSVRDGVNVRVYPRVCGGTDAMMEIVTDYLGLSPRVRGNLDDYAQ